MAEAALITLSAELMLRKKFSISTTYFLVPLPDHHSMLFPLFNIIKFKLRGTEKRL